MRLLSESKRMVSYSILSWQLSNDKKIISFIKNVASFIIKMTWKLLAVYRRRHTVGRLKLLLPPATRVDAATVVELSLT